MVLRFGPYFFEPCHIKINLASIGFDRRYLRIGCQLYGILNGRSILRAQNFRNLFDKDKIGYINPLVEA